MAPQQPSPPAAPPSARKAGYLAQGSGVLALVVVTLPATALAGVLLRSTDGGDLAGMAGAVLAACLGVAAGALASVGAVWWALLRYCRRTERPRPGVEATIAAAAYAAWILLVGYWTTAVPIHQSALRPLAFLFPLTLLPGIGVGLAMHVRFGRRRRRPLTAALLAAATLLVTVTGAGLVMGLGRAKVIPPGPDVSGVATVQPVPAWAGVPRSAVPRSR